MPLDPSRLRGLTASCSYSRLFFSNQLPTSNFIETPARRSTNMYVAICDISERLPIISNLSYSYLQDGFYYLDPYIFKFIHILLNNNKTIT